MTKKLKIEKNILKHAKHNFMTQGIMNTVMGDIAKDAELSVRTLYRYFDSKEDLVFAVVIEILHDWNNFQTRIFKELKSDGLTALQEYLKKLVIQIDEREQELILLSEFDFYFRNVDPDLIHEKRLNEYESIILVSDGFLNTLLEEAIIKKEVKAINRDLFVATLSNVLWAFAQRIATRKEIIQKETNFEGLTLIEAQIDMYMAYLKEGNHESI